MVFSINDKLGSNPVHSSDIANDVDWVQKSYLDELRCMGPRYSWSNR